jgi:3-phosphoshikimate 1-carboxyvinyltransferase
LEYTIASDWSNAAFLLVAGAIAGSVTVTGLDVFSAQGDKKILEALQDCGCFLSVSTESIRVRKNENKAFHFDATDCPDLFPPLVALATHCSGRSVIEGVHRLLHKESNRALSLQNEFKKLGIEIIIQDDMMIITGGKVRGGKVYSHNDHRIAMALAVAALGAEAAVEIEAAEAVAKSWPGFFEALRQLSVRQE